VNTGRVVLLLTCLAVAGLGGWFAVTRWDDANKIAAFASALGAVAAVGVAIWAALRTTSSGSIVVRRTGAAESRGGSANTGMRGRAAGSVRVEDTGAATSDGGDANTGAELD
jgi:hypothetical protein